MAGTSQKRKKVNELKLQNFPLYNFHRNKFSQVSWFKYCGSIWVSWRYWRRKKSRTTWQNTEKVESIIVLDSKRDPFLSSIDLAKVKNTQLATSKATKILRGLRTRIGARKLLIHKKPHKTTYLGKNIVLGKINILKFGHFFGINYVGVEDKTANTHFAKIFRERTCELWKKADVLGLYSVNWRKIAGTNQKPSRRLYAQRTRCGLPLYAWTFPVEQLSGRANS